MRLTKEEIERWKSEAGYSPGFNRRRLEAVCDHALQREQDVADLVETADGVVNAPIKDMKPHEFMERFNALSRLVARIREQPTENPSQQPPATSQEATR